MADKPIKPTVSFTPITEVDKKKLRNKTAFSLPDNPTARGMKPNEIKKYLYSAIIDFDDTFISKHPSVVGMIETLLSETETAFNTSDSYVEAVLKYIEDKINDLDTGLQEEINATNEELAKTNEALATTNSKIIQETSDRITVVKELQALITNLQNAGFITKEVSNLTNYYKKAETYSKDEIDELYEVLAGLGIEFNVVETLPPIGENKYIYLLSAKDSQDQDIYEEYIYIRGAWERIGSTAVNLANYYTKSQIDALLKNYAPKHWEGTRQEFEQAQDSIAVGTICIIKESNGDVTIETKTAILGKAVLGQMILGKGE